MPVRHRTRPLWPAMLLLAALAPVFAGLGFWQLQRAVYKQSLQRIYEQRAQAEPLSLDAIPHTAEELRYRRVRVRGVYEPDYQFLLDNQVHRGRAGYHVLTPIRLDGSDRRVLVNRGWVALGASRAQLPAIDAPPGLQEFTGIATVPSPPGFRFAEEPPAPGWHPVWSHLDLDRYALSVPFTVLPAVVLPEADGAGSFERLWPRFDSGIAMHRGYAVQWFALAALAAVILLLMLHRARQRRPGRKKP